MRLIISRSYDPNPGHNRFAREQSREMRDLPWETVGRQRFYQSKAFKVWSLLAILALILGAAANGMVP